jgi:CheY-like chemotaxis protein
LNTWRAQVVDAHSRAEALELARSSPFDLVLVNRIGDHDGEPGMRLIHDLKADPLTRDLPVMLVSNFAEAQAEAVAAGALNGFGKAEIESPRFTQSIAAALGPPAV